jgi:hypothetical protein
MFVQAASPRSKRAKKHLPPDGIGGASSFPANMNSFRLSKYIRLGNTFGFRYNGKSRMAEEELSMKDFDYLSDSTEQTSTRFVTFVTPNLARFDLAITTTNRFYGKKLVVDMQSGRSGVLGPDDLEEEGVLESVFKISETEAAELAQFLVLVLGAVHFTD